MQLFLTKNAPSKAATLRTIRKVSWQCTETLPGIKEAADIWKAVEAGGEWLLADALEESVAEKGLNELVKAGCQGELRPEPDGLDDDEVVYLGDGPGVDVRLALLLCSLMDPLQALQLCRAFNRLTHDEIWLAAATVIIATFAPSQEQE